LEDVPDRSPGCRIFGQEVTVGEHGWGSTNHTRRTLAEAIVRRSSGRPSSSVDSKRSSGAKPIVPRSRSRSAIASCSMGDKFLTLTRVDITRPSPKAVESTPVEIGTSAVAAVAQEAAAPATDAGSPPEIKQAGRPQSDIQSVVAAGSRVGVAVPFVNHVPRLCGGRRCCHFNGRRSPDAGIEAVVLDRRFDGRSTRSRFKDLFDRDCLLLLPDDISYRRATCDYRCRDDSECGAQHPKCRGTLGVLHAQRLASLDQGIVTPVATCSVPRSCAAAHLARIEVWSVLRVGG
jgi:hypothetical protein